MFRGAFGTIPSALVMTGVTAWVPSCKDEPSKGEAAPDQERMSWRRDQTCKPRGEARVVVGKHFAMHRRGREATHDARACAALAPHPAVWSDARSPPSLHAARCFAEASTLAGEDGGQSRARKAKGSPALASNGPCNAPRAVFGSILCGPSIEGFYPAEPGDCCGDASLV